MQFVNMFSKIIQRFVSRLERRENRTDRVIANTFKMYIIQLFNTAILLLVVNMNIGFLPSWFPVFAGDFEDFSSKWYIEVGSAISIFMFFSIFSPHIANFGYHVIFWLWQWYDRGFSCNKKKTRQLFQIDYEKLYLGPEYMLEYRYSNMMTMIFIALMFGAGIPILYAFIFFTFLITYWVDKISLLRIYRKPPKYGKKLMRATREW